ncbi:tetratricopeptide repeat protein [candidate division TA06 bacterium]|uniref:Tetratricopeptide repeat protein n=1 Tax=candidate division TA06 bacterium TaxID=2250710 RepID=A0A523UV79_UNCT6|nr:MAG: tetratricopeptide repeat protein [candidate division TA06 bacterium]
MTPLEKRLETNKDRFEALSREEHFASAKKCIAKLGGSYRALGLWEDALRVFDIGLSRSLKASDVGGISEFLTWKSNVHYHMGQYGRAIELAAEGLGLEIPDSDRANRISYYLANPYLMLGDIERYIALEEQALEITKKLAGKIPENLEPWILCRLAKGQDMLGVSQKTNPVLTEQVQRFRNLRQTYGIPFSLLILGKNLLGLGKLDEARQTLTESLNLYQKNVQEGFVVDVLVELSEVALTMENCEEARLHVDRAIEEARKGPRKAEGLADKRHLNQALVQGAKVYLRLNGRDRALCFYEEALDLALESNRKLMITELLGLQKTLTDSI